MGNTMNEAIKAKMVLMSQGQQVIVSDSDLDILEAMECGTQIRTIPNPNRMGTKDVYLASLSPFKGYPK